MENVYKIKSKCDNCFEVQILDFPKGRNITSVYIPCDFCGCDSWVKIENLPKGVNPIIK